MINILILAHFHKFWKLSQFFIFEKKTQKENVQVRTQENRRYVRFGIFRR
jgi:hypothetical protein